MNFNPLMDRRKSVSPAALKNERKKMELSDQLKDVYGKRRQSMPQPSLQSVLFGQALYKISDTVRDICTGIPVDPLPKAATNRSKAVAHAPRKKPKLTAEKERELVLDALQYFPIGTHDVLEPEFADELKKYGHIYMYRFRPTLKMRAYPLCHYPVVTHKAAAAMQMIMGMLDPKVAKYPHELVTYDGRGQVFSNWAQFWLAMYYLSTMTEDHTLVIYSGHPAGLFPSFPTAPRVVVTNGIVKIPKTLPEAEQEIFSVGVSMFGHIGPQAVVHATMITMISVYRKFKGSDDLNGKVFVSAGLGEMGCAQALASKMNGCIGVIAEVDDYLIEKWQKEEWITEVVDDLDELIARVRKSKTESKGKCIAYHGNVVDVWERFAEELESTGELLVDIGTDQTNLKRPFSGGYVPAQLTLDEMDMMMKKNPEKFKKCVQKCLRYHVLAINKLTDAGMIFWEYGNNLQYEADQAGAEIYKTDDAPARVFKYPTYGTEIIGDLVSVGFSPFRWTFTSGSPNDLSEMDKEVVKILEDIAQANITELPPITPLAVHDYYKDSIKWMQEVQKYKWNYGTMSRMLYTDVRGRVAIALAFNKAINNDVIKGPVVLSRDYHDAKAIGNALKASENKADDGRLHSDLAIQSCLGDSFRGATWISVNNAQNVGLDQILDGGFGLVIDGSEEAEKKAKVTLSWDIANGVAQRAWSGNIHAKATINRAMKDNRSLKITVPHLKSDVKKKTWKKN
ncbi:urocanate hydratase-like [Rhopilema esculentum]|uniref:urocanate hydratase-like n=1 Tax=Rhopilema esculentum TaxID=499914 RepID=UPI0031D2D870